MVISKFLCILSHAESAIPLMIIISNVGEVREHYTILSFPPRRCRDNQYSYYSDILPQNVIAVSATLMLVIIGLVIYKVGVMVNRAW